MSGTADVDVDRVVDLADRVRRVATESPDRVALIHAHRGRPRRWRYTRHTYRELSDRAERLAAAMAGIGVVEGTRCSVMVPPGIDAMVLCVALWRVGAVVVGIEPHSHGLRAVARSLATVEPEVFFGSAPAVAARAAFGWGRGSVRTTVVVANGQFRCLPSLRSLLDGPMPTEPASGRITPGDPAVIAFTTGSTGAPKPTVLRQRNLAAMMDLVLDQWGSAGEDVVDLITFPMFWIIGLAAGGTAVVPPIDFALRGPGDADPAKLLRTIEDCGATSMFASPALLTNLAAHVRASGGQPLPLRRIVAGGAEVPGPLFAAVRSVLGPGAEMYGDYGATEALPVAEIAGSEVVDGLWAESERGRGVCVGRPLPGVEVRIVDIVDAPIADWSRATVLGTGQIGEVVARSPHISEDYWQRPEATRANKIPDGLATWHRLGDTGYLDAEGRLWVCGRVSHRVTTDRGTVFPLCCEPVANAHPAVRRSALVGVPGERGTEAVLCVELVAPGDPGPVVDELRIRLDEHATTRLITRIEVVDAIGVDRRHNAKIDRPAVAAALRR